MMSASVMTISVMTTSDDHISDDCMAGVGGRFAFLEFKTVEEVGG